jgi:hypothetical protein
MSRDRSSRRRRGERPEGQTRPVAPAAPRTPAPAAPRPPALRRYAFMFFTGILIGRVASESFPTGLVETVDLLMVTGLALTAALSWRAWARNAMESRRREQLRRRKAQQRVQEQEPREPLELEP